MYDVFLLLSFLALLFFPYLIVSWSDWREVRDELQLERSNRRLAFAEDEPLHELF